MTGITTSTYHVFPHREEHHANSHRDFLHWKWNIDTGVWPNCLKEDCALGVSYMHSLVLFRGSSFPLLAGSWLTMIYRVKSYFLSSTFKTFMGLIWRQHFIYVSPIISPPKLFNLLHPIILILWPWLWPNCSPVHISIHQDIQVIWCFVTSEKSFSTICHLQNVRTGTMPLASYLSCSFYHSNCTLCLDMTYLL